MSPLASLVAYLILYPIAALVRAFVLTLLWAWYMVPTFGLPALGFVQAIGLSIIVSFLTAHLNVSRAKDMGVVETLISSVIYSLVTLVFGAFWTLFL